MRVRGRRGPRLRRRSNWASYRSREFGARLAALRARFSIDIAAIGKGTNAGTVAATVRDAGLPFALVDEHETSLQARARFFVDFPPRGWRRLIPRGMLLPDRPIDDYAALLIAERYLRQGS